MAARKKAKAVPAPTQEDAIKAYCEKNNVAYDILTEEERQLIIDSMEEEEELDEPNPVPIGQLAANAPSSSGTVSGPTFALYHFKDTPTMIYIGSDKGMAFDALMTFGEKNEYISRNLKVDYAK